MNKSHVAADLHPPLSACEGDIFGLCRSLVAHDALVQQLDSALCSRGAGPASAVLLPTAALGSGALCSGTHSRYRSRADQGQPEVGALCKCWRLSPDGLQQQL